MERNPIAGEHRAQSRARRWAREIVLAALLTVAAAIFITVALLRGDSKPDGLPFDTARQLPASE